MAGNAYPRAPPQGYVSSGYVYNQYPATYQSTQYPYPQVTPSQGHVIAGPQQLNAGAPPYCEAPPPYTEYPTNPQPPAQQNLCFENAFDYRARFDGIAQPTIPPPPPGIAPNPAQIAAMQGHHVTATQEHRDVTWSFD